jgi:hypothetical protein
MRLIGIIFSSSHILCKDMQRIPGQLCPVGSHRAQMISVGSLLWVVGILSVGFRRNPGRNPTERIAWPGMLNFYNYCVKMYVPNTYTKTQFSRFLSDTCVILWEACATNTRVFYLFSGDIICASSFSLSLYHCCDVITCMYSIYIFFRSAVMRGYICVLVSSMFRYIRFLSRSFYMDHVCSLSCILATSSFSITF